MLPRDLKLEQFNSYPPEAKKLVKDYLGTFQPLPLSFVASLLREVIDYDFKFPAERRTLERELANLSSLSSEQTNEWVEPFTKITLTSKLEHFDCAASWRVFHSREA